MDIGNIFVMGRVCECVCAGGLRDADFYTALANSIREDRRAALLNNRLQRSLVLETLSMLMI